MIGNLSSIRHEKLLRDNIFVGDVLGYKDGSRERYFGVLEFNPTRINGELRIKEICRSNWFEEPRIHMEGSQHGDSFTYDIDASIRDFTKVSHNEDRITKNHLCKVVAAATFMINELRTSLVESGI